MRSLGSNLTGTTLNPLSRDLCHHKMWPSITSLARWIVPTSLLTKSSPGIQQGRGVIENSVTGVKEASEIKVLVQFGRTDRSRKTRNRWVGLNLNQIVIHLITEDGELNGHRY